MSKPEETLAKAVAELEEVAVMAKARVAAYTRKDGTMVREHDDGKMLSSAPKVDLPGHVKNWSDKAHFLQNMPEHEKTPAHKELERRALKQSMFGKGYSEEYKKHMAANKGNGRKPKAGSYDHPNVVGHAEKLQGGDASKAHGFHFAGKEFSSSGKEGKSAHDGTPVRHFRELTESGRDDGQHVWLDHSGRVHADSTSEVSSLRKQYEAHQKKGGS